jgi:hypothetical protein
MPRTDFSLLPDDARLWIFAAAEPIIGDRAALLLARVDAYLEQWKAHGAPLTCSRDWREERFLAIAVDQQTTGASGCSIDALFRILQELQPHLGTTLVGGGRIYYRDSKGDIHCVSRSEFASQLASGIVHERTHVFDTTITTLGDYRSVFERPVATSWHRQLAPQLR